MPIEAGDFVQDLVPANPPSDDPVQEGDNHLRLIKQVLQNTFPNGTRAIYDQKSTAVAVNTTLTSASNKQIIEVNASAASRTITLPALNATNDGWSVIILKVDSSVNPVVIAPPTGTIQSQPNVQLAGPFESAEIIWTGTQFRTTQRAFRQWIRTRQVNATETLTIADYGRLILANPTSGNITLSLPTLVNFAGAVIGIKHIGTEGRRVTIDANGTQEIDGATTYAFDNTGDCVWMVSDGTKWETYAFKVGRGFSPNQINNWTATQIFVGASLVLAEQTLTVVGGNIAWNHDLGNHAKVNITTDATFAKPSNMRIGQSGFLRISVDGDNDINFNSVFFFIGSEPELGDESLTILEYFVSASGNIYIWVVAGGTAGITVYNKGVASAGNTYTQAHGLGGYPKDANAFLLCTNAGQGFSVGDLYKLGGDSVGDNDRGSSLTFNETEVIVQIGNAGMSGYPPGNGNTTIFSLSNFDVLIRVIN